MRRLSPTLLFWMFLACFSPAILPAQLRVATGYGTVQGVAEEGVWAFRGIPYAAPPVGALRWQPPQPPAVWDTVRLAESFAPSCPQKRFEASDPDNGIVEGEEDCLYLNVWTADTAGARPVMVFIHGGGNQQGSAAQPLAGTPLYSGRFLAARGDVVVVTINYRLGPLGFLAHPALAAESPRGVSGNYGILDQIMALEWVRKNIARFGGDPGCVMVFGESAGALDTGVLLTSPLSEGLFHRALLQSGAPVAVSAAAGEARGIDLAASLGCGGTPEEQLDCLRRLTPAQLVAGLEPPLSGGIVSGGWRPVVDGWVLPRDPFDALSRGEFHHMPVVVGSNADEMALYAPLVVTPAQVRAFFETAVPPALRAEGLRLYPPGNNNLEARRSFVRAATDGQFTAPARRTARAIAASQEAPVWRYFYSHSLGGPFALFGASHGLELPLVFQTIEASDYAAGGYLNDRDRAVAAFLLGYWTRFAATGDPNGAGQPAWPRYEPQADPYLDIDASPAAGAGLRTEECDFWDRLRETVTAREVIPRPTAEAPVLVRFPNPIAPGEPVVLTCRSRSFVEVSTTGLGGRRAKVLFRGVLPPGTHTIPWEAPLPTKGVFLLRVRADGWMNTWKVVSR